MLSSSQQHVKDNPKESEQDYLSWLLNEIKASITHSVIEAFKEHIRTTTYSKRVVYKIGNVEKLAISLLWQVFALNAKDETFKTLEEMQLSRNTYEIVKQLPKNYFQYHMDIEWEPVRNPKDEDKVTATEKRWFKSLHEEIKRESILWFLDYVYRLRNALFHEIIDPLDEEWQIIFKSAYLVLKEIVDMNIQELGQ